MGMHRFRRLFYIVLGLSSITAVVKLAIFHSGPLASRLTKDLDFDRVPARDQQLQLQTEAFRTANKPQPRESLNTADADDISQPKIQRNNWKLKPKGGTSEDRDNYRLGEPNPLKPNQLQRVWDAETTDDKSAPRNRRFHRNHEEEEKEEEGEEEGGGGRESDYDNVKTVKVKSEKHNRTSTVLLLSSARSGSSLTGDILNHDPGVYYVFEPLKLVEKELRTKVQQSPEKNESAVFEAIRAKFFMKHAKKILDAIFSCRYSDLDLSGLDKDFLMRYPETTLLARCHTPYLMLRELRENATDSADQEWLRPLQKNVTSCITAAEKFCKRMNTSVVKVIRLQIRDLDPIMRDNPDLRVILLVRDPRASIWSRAKTFEEPIANNSEEFANRHCSHIADDILSAAKMNMKYPDRIRLFRYEILAEHPLRVSKNMYDYIGLKWTKRVRDRIVQQTQPAHSPVTPRDAAKKYKDPYAVVREDSSQTAHAWRRKADWSFVQVVQAECSDLLRQLGYQIFASARDLNRTSEVPSLAQTKLHLEGVRLLE